MLNHNPIDSPDTIEATFSTAQTATGWPTGEITSTTPPESSDDPADPTTEAAAPPSDDTLDDVDEDEGQPDESDDGDESVEDAADPSDDGGLIRARNQAANYRARLRDTEAERDRLAAQLAAQQRALIALRSREFRRAAGGLDDALLDAAGVDLAALADEDTGVLDIGRVDEFLLAALQRFGLPVDHTGMAPDRAQGAGGLGPFGNQPRAGIESAFQRHRS